MKKFTVKTLASALLLAGLSGVITSCKDYLDVSPDALYTSEAVFSSVAGATSAIIGAYQELAGDQGYGIRVSMYFPYDTDEMISSPSSSPDITGRRGIARYHATSSNTEINNPWINFYQGVERANICIKNIPQMDLYSNGTASDKTELRRLYGEALALRALYLQELVRNWGDVPAQFAASESGQDFNLPNADRNATLAHLVDDLKIAEDLVPWRSQVAVSNERFTKGGIKALRARIALQRGGYSENPRTGQMERQADYLDYYRIAQQECADLMTTTARAEHNLNPSFFNVFKSINELHADNTHEVMMEVAMGGSSGTNDSKLGYYDGPRHYGSLTYGTSSGGILAVPTYFYAFDSTDTRRDVTICTFSIGNSSTVVTSPLSDNQYGVALNAITDGKFRRYWRSTPVPGTSNYLGYNWPIIRFADVLLMFAETENELNGPTAAAQNALLEVRTRAYGTRTAAQVGLNLSSKASMFDAIQRERWLEFGAEGIRKYDLLRWNLLGAKINEAKANLALMSAGTAPYANVPQKMYYRTLANGQIQWLYSFYKPGPTATPTGATSVNWRSNINATYVANLQPGSSAGMASDYEPNKGKELLPIPQATLDTDPALRQNYGY